jgi:trehalose synthase-fused probable maltokinase
MADAPAAATFGPGWLVRQRWFRSKGRPIASVTEADRAPLGGRMHLLVLAVGYADGGSDRYLVPAIVDRDVVREPIDSDGAWTALLTAIATDAELRGARGRFACTPTATLADLLPSAAEAAAALPERRLGVEQTNTSVAFGARLILKLYRRLEAGINPDVEVSAFLTDAGFDDTPALAGAIAYLPDGGEACAAGMLQAFVTSDGDAWSAVLGALRTDVSAATRSVATIGSVTAKMHAALSSRPGDADFPARPATVAETAGWRASAERQLAQAVSAVSGPEHERLIALAPAIRARFADAFGAATGGALVTRIHGDYHLGQLLSRTDGGFAVIDFEGEPARPIAERRVVTSPLRDVAGMLRSLDYAVRTAAREGPLDADLWLAQARAALLTAYGGIPPAEAGLVDAFELEKACYEVGYEANNRPDWLWLPLDALERLAA